MSKKITNNLFHKDCPLDDKRKLEITLKGEYCYSENITKKWKSIPDSIESLLTITMTNICAYCTHSVWGSLFRKNSKKK